MGAGPLEGATFGEFEPFPAAGIGPLAFAGRGRRTWRCFAGRGRNVPGNG